ncbi:MAG: hypothetical protein EZS28_051106, partial [Streblomastix strix]
YVVGFGGTLILADQIAQQLGFQKKEVSLGLSHQGLQQQQSIQPQAQPPVFQSIPNANIKVPPKPTTQPNLDYLTTIRQDLIPQIPAYRTIEEIPQEEMNRLKKLHVICPITLRV